jgi:hypothetical protein
MAKFYCPFCKVIVIEILDDNKCEICEEVLCIECKYKERCCERINLIRRQSYM